MPTLLRFEIEQGLMDGSVAVKDVPSVWAAKMKELLGVDVPGDAEGCLQDIHWCVCVFAIRLCPPPVHMPTTFLLTEDTCTLQE